MKIGFTGTREGMTDEQLQVVHKLLGALDAQEFHHGQCKGADEESCLIAKEFGICTVSHPPINNYMKSCVESDQYRAPNGYLERDCNIVIESDILIAAPNSYSDKKGSGTWYTINQSRKFKKPRYIIFPDGTYIYEHS